MDPVLNELDKIKIDIENIRISHKETKFEIIKITTAIKKTLEALLLDKSNSKETSFQINAAIKQLNKIHEKNINNFRSNSLNGLQ